MRPRWRCRPVRPAARPAVVALLVLLVTFGVPSGLPPATLDWRLAQITRAQSFDLWSWEISTLFRRSAGAVIAPPSAANGPALARVYVQLSQRAARERSERDDIWTRATIDGAMGGENPQLARAEQMLDRTEAELNRLRPGVEGVLSAEIEDELRRQQIWPGLTIVGLSGAPPFLRLSIVPGVFFQLGPLPDLLVIAPRDRIALIGSVLIRPGLPPAQIDRIERQADALDVSSVVTGIGGLAAYPSLVPDEGSVRDLLVTVAHEWTHHYLALRPLGQAYFDSYDMREINETVADIVGEEVGTAVYRRFYEREDRQEVSAVTSVQPADPGRPDFWTLMRRVRRAVEGYLARGDVSGAEAYMANAQRELARQGYFIRRLNTAYLAFFGSYAAMANPFEAKLRQLRAQTGSLAAFLETVSRVRRPEDLDRLLSETRGRPS
ncbi:MAG: hypothetical protein IRY83_05910 [Chloroflexi bacterium]|nr:hypothetical protein [Chloroflexota bacterium]